MRALPLLLLAACTSPPAEVTTVRRDKMTTYVSISIAAPKEPRVLAAIEAGFAEIDRLEPLISEWKPESQVSGIVASAGTAPVKVGDEAFELLTKAQEVSVLTEGAFDVTVGALWGAWDFRWQEPRIPTAEELSRRTALIDYRKLELDAAARTAFLRDKGMALTLGGISKGFIADRVSAVLTAAGFPDHLIACGGDLRISGRKGGAKWKVGIRDPASPNVWGTLEAEDEGISTAGNYERFFVKDGVRYHHILDPKSGMPARGVASVTVRAPTSTLADALDTGLFVMGQERGLALAERLPGVEALFFTEPDFSVHATTGLRDAVTRTDPEVLAGRPEATR
jgi:FAD:protein FMN transferase